MIPEQVMRDRSTVLVIALVGKEAAPLWWSSPNKAFDNKVPSLANHQEVYTYLMGHASGNFS